MGVIRFSNYRVEIFRVYEDDPKSQVSNAKSRTLNNTPGLKIVSCQKLDIYTKAMELFFKVHPLSLKLPRHELYELGSQLRRSSDAVVNNIVEGYGRRRYKAEYIKFLNSSSSSNYETQNHLLKLKKLYTHLEIELGELETEYTLLGGKLNSYIHYVEQNWEV